ncbi:MAG TPA: tol-pal system protein YbgF, partial [Candidatus Dormibacteraeota bacterium]|nr:tol-pal system protein YbgF [Candidatus Dormibacteraeota bacterium]
MLPLDGGGVQPGAAPALAGGVQPGAGSPGRDPLAWLQPEPGAGAFQPGIASGPGCGYAGWPKGSSGT